VTAEPLSSTLVEYPLSFPLENLLSSTGASAALLPLQPIDARRSTEGQWMHNWICRNSAHLQQS
jgi:hypothetical protein